MMQGHKGGFGRRGVLIAGAAAILLSGMSSAPTNDPAPPTKPTPAAGGPAGKWIAESIDGVAVDASVKTTLEITAEGRAGGKAGCNNYGGAVTIDGKSITFGNMAATMMMCPEPAMGQERRYLRALDAVRSFTIDGEPGKLLLRDETDTTLIVLGPG